MCTGLRLVPPSPSITAVDDRVYRTGHCDALVTSAAMLGRS
jgi:hypothetical protein